MYKRGKSPVCVNQILKDLNELIQVHPALKENEFQLTPLAEETAVKINEHLDSRGKRLEDVSIKELRDICEQVVR